MINFNATAFEQTWLTKYKKMSPRDRLFLEIMTFAFIGTQAEQSDISVKKIKTNKLVNGITETCYQYTITVLEDEQSARETNMAKNRN
ncbi:hypothetical protein [Enterococcus mundtii]|uniref:Uncharacterized protein n=1 Tax=Enterococcus mundtii TaxID=53346 RepID=A0A1V2UHH2_ENTMU|nr:hypothetical protein [Enterococcus mundtii]ONN42677.1 hypothetical protein BTN92_10440 [Enterococcus mundtii]